MTTRIEDLKQRDGDTIKKSYEDSDIYDFSIPETIRLKLLANTQNAIEIVNKLNTMYSMSGIKSLHDFLYKVCTETNLDINIRVQTAKHLCDTAEGYKALNYICGNSLGLSITCYIDAVCWLACNEKYKKSCKYYLLEVINKMSLNSEYRYKVILTLEKKVTNNDIVNYLQLKLATKFVLSEHNENTHRILAAQIVFSKTTNKKLLKQVENIIMNMAKNKTIEYNTRADAADFLMRHTKGKTHNKAVDIIMELGEVDGLKPRSVFDNAQNVHSQEIENSSIESIEFLNTVELAYSNTGGLISFDDIVTNINELLQTDKKHSKRKIKLALNRIYMDRIKYTKFHFTLLTILLRVWSYILKHKDSHELQLRLLDELEDMSSTCSSGCAYRLVNTLSGFGDVSVQISWRDQIISNFIGRLNSRIQAITDETLRDTILSQMTESNMSDKIEFLRFIKRNLSSIREEMYSEFKKHITDTDFDLYFKDALIKYEL